MDKVGAVGGSWDRSMDTSPGDSNSPIPKTEAVERFKSLMGNGGRGAQGGKEQPQEELDAGLEGELYAGTGRKSGQEPSRELLRDSQKGIWQQQSTASDGSQRNSGPTAAAKNDAQPSDLSAIFSSFSQSPIFNAAPAAAQQAQAPAPGAELQQIVDDMVERILVSTPRLDGSKEVLISLSNTGMLPDTEISITRDLNGMLFVAITTSDSNSLQRLITARAQLEEKLSEHEKNAFRIDIVNRRDDSQGDRGDQEDQRGTPS